VNGVDAVHHMIKRTECNGVVATPQEAYVGEAYVANSTVLPASYLFYFMLNKYEFSDGSIYEEYGSTTHSSIPFTRSEWKFVGDAPSSYDNTIFFSGTAMRANMTVSGSNLVVSFVNTTAIPGWRADATGYRYTTACTVVSY
jgi:hypothetical protein